MVKHATFIKKISTKGSFPSFCMDILGHQNHLIFKILNACKNKTQILMRRSCLLIEKQTTEHDYEIWFMLA